MLLASSTASIRRAMDRWKSLWHAVHNSNQVDDSRSIGFTKHSMDIWWVANKVVDLVNDEEARSGYLLGIATDSLEDLHMFLKQYMSK